MRILLSVLLAYSVNGPSTAMAQMAAPPGPGRSALALAKPVSVGLQDDLGMLIDGAVRPDGSACTIDYSSTRVLCYSPRGKLLWRMGRKGQGPGEFELPCRIASDHSGRLLIYDMSQRAITWLGTDGKFIRRKLVPLGLSQVNNMRVLPDGSIAIAGYAPRGGKAGGFGVHVFSDTLAYLRSFGDLPRAIDPMVLEHWGSGTVSVLGNGRIAYSRAAPADVAVFDGSGREVARIRAPMVKTTIVDSAFDIRRGPTGIQIGRSAKPIQNLGLVFSASRNQILVTRLGATANAGFFWDLYSADGTLVESMAAPAGWDFPFGLTPDGILWAIGSVGGEPALVHSQLQFRP